MRQDIGGKPARALLADRLTHFPHRIASNISLEDRCLEMTDSAILSQNIKNQRDGLEGEGGQRQNELRNRITGEPPHLPLERDDVKRDHAQQRGSLPRTLEVRANALPSGMSRQYSDEGDRTDTADSAQI